MNIDEAKFMNPHGRALASILSQMPKYRITTYVGDIIFYRLSEDTRCKVELTSSDVRNNANIFDTIQISILNIHTGVIDKQSFLLHSFIHDENVPDFYMRDDLRRFVGYVPTEEDFTRIAETIDKYISVFACKD